MKRYEYMWLNLVSPDRRKYRGEMLPIKREGLALELRYKRSEARVIPTYSNLRSVTSCTSSPISASLAPSKTATA